MSQKSFTLISTSGYRNLLAALVAAGYKGTALLSHLYIICKSDTSLFVILTDTAAQPASPSDGIPIGNLEESTQFQVVQAKLDASRVWLYSASSVSPKITVIGEGI